MSDNTGFQSFSARLLDFIKATSERPYGHPAQSEVALCPAGQEFNALALTLFALQFAHNPDYHRFCQARRTSPEKVEHWSQIPAVPTRAFKELELSCLPPNKRTTVFFSSGTTQDRPSRHFHSQDSLAVYEKSALSWFESAGPLWGLSDNSMANAQIRKSSTGLHLVSLTPDKAAAPHSSLVHMFETIGASRHFTSCRFFGKVADDGAWTLDLPVVQKRLQQTVADAEPIMLVGTAFSFVHLVDYCVEHELAFALPQNSRVLETGGYKGRSRSLTKPELHSLIASRLGIPPANIICEYGMAELSSQAYDTTPAGPPRSEEQQSSPQDVPRSFFFCPWARAQVISPETGREATEDERGLIRVFDLANVYSVLAIQTEDLAIHRGTGFELIGRLRQAEARGCSLMTLER